MAIATGNPAGMAGAAQAGGAGVAQRYYRRFSPLERVCRSSSPTGHGRPRSRECSVASRARG